MAVLTEEEKQERLRTVLELQEQGKTLREISKILGIGESGLKSFLNRLDYYSVNGIYSKKSNTNSTTMINTDSNTQSNTHSNTVIEVPAIVEAPPVPSLEPQQEEAISLLVEERETLQDMLSWYKKYRALATSDIIIELPISENTMTSCRSNKAIWEQFGEFATNNKTFPKGDLLAQALKEFMDKYK